MSAVDAKEITQDEGIDIDTFSNSGIQQHVEWTRDHENILVEWADKAMCYRWLHSKAHQHYARSNMWFTIPVIIMSTTTAQLTLHKNACQKIIEVMHQWL